MVINELVYQKGEYWTYLDSKKGLFVVCRDDYEKGYASVVGVTKSWEVAKDMVDKAGEFGFCVSFKEMEKLVLEKLRLIR